MPFAGWFAVHYNIQFTQTNVASTNIGCGIDWSQQDSVYIPPIHGAVDDGSEKKF